jgi:hypothetical protein
MDSQGEGEDKVKKEDIEEAQESLPVEDPTPSVEDEGDLLGESWPEVHEAPEEEF